MSDLTERSTVVVDRLRNLDPAPFGVNSHESAAMIERLATLGVRWHRVDVAWCAVQAGGSDSYNWEVVDAVVAAAERCGASLLASVAYTPRWASRPQDQHGLNDTQLKALPPADPGRYVEFVGRFIELYGRRLQVVSLWNEPNLPDFWKGSCGQYLDLIVPALRRAREVNPALPIAGPDLSSSPSHEPGRWLTEILKATDFAGPNALFDIVTQHQYDGENTPAGRAKQIDSLYSLLSAHGLGGRPIWITETGWDYPHFTRDDQNRNLRNVMDEMHRRAGWWGKTFWYDSHGGDANIDWGLVGPDLLPDAGQARPALGVYAEVIKAAGITPPVGRSEAERRVALMYRTLLDREPDPAGLAANTDALMRGSTEAVCAGAFLGGPEFAKRRSECELSKLASSILVALGQPTDPAAIASLVGQIATNQAAGPVAEMIARPVVA